MVSVVSFHTVSLAFEGFRITRISAAHPAFTCSKLSIETLEQGVKCMFKVNNKDTSRSGIFIVNFEHISHLPCFSVSIVNFEHVIAGWVQMNFN